MSLTAQDLLTKLVAHPVFGGESNLSVMEEIRTYLHEHGVKTHLVPNEVGDKASLHCRIGPAVDGGVILSGHMDVVPVAGQDWHTDPFVLTEKKDEKLYARGSCDMKGFIACCLATLPQMVSASLEKPIYFAFSYDEEIGCLAAPELVQHIKDTYAESPTYAIIGEPSMMIPTIGQKGISIYTTTVNGSAGHSSRIRSEVSAIHEATRLIQWLENKMESLVAAGHIDERFTPPHTTLHVGKIQGGIATNVIADSCTFYWDIRTIPQDDLNSILEDFAAYCQEREAILRDKFPGFSIVTEEDHPPVPPLDTQEDSPIVAFVKELSGVDELDAVSYAAEAGQFAEGGFESIICGPGSIVQAHRANEFISKAQLDAGVAFLEKLIQKLSK